MRWERDPRDRRYPERLAGSTIASLVLHALFALLFFALVTSSSQQGATENNPGGEIVTIERRSPVAVTNAPAAQRPAPPVPHAPRVAPLRPAPLVQPQAQRLPANRHELARVSPSAPPNPRPIPQRTPQPNPQPTRNVYEVKPRNALPAAPLSIPTVAPLAVAVKPPPTAAPSPAPTAVPSARPSPKPPVPKAAATAKAATPAPPAPTASPTTAPPAVRATSAPSASPAPLARASAPPAAHPGVPSPSPTRAAIVSKAVGPAAVPGPHGGPSPGPHAGVGPQRKPSPPRPISVVPTPSPRPVRTKPPAAASNLNARLRALLPNGPVHPSEKQYVPQLSLRGRMHPTPPPSVLAETKYLYRSHGGSEGEVVMWVVRARKAGFTTICTGWLVRYPLAERPSLPGQFAPANGTSIAIGGPRGAPPLMPPVVEGMVTQPCEGRLLVPFAGSSASSP
jgi:hypothetical protein